MHPKLVVPRLQVHKDWYKGLAEDFIDHDHPDVGGHVDAEIAARVEQQQQVSGYLCDVVCILHTSHFDII